MSIELGLRNIVALESDISRVDGENGILEYRGYNIKELAENCSFEEVSYLLLNKHLPTKSELDVFSKELIKKRELSSEIVDVLYKLPRITHPTVILRTIVSYLGSMDERLHIMTTEEHLSKSKNLIAKLPTIVAYYQKIREGKALIRPSKSMRHATNFIWMLNGKKPNALEERAMDLNLVLHAEQTLAASTFSARIAASTLSDMYAGVVAATGVLFGSLHGGSSQKVIEMLREIRRKEIEKWVDMKIQKGERIMGFGHRVFNKKDPRVEKLREVAKELDNARGNNWVSISDRLAKIVNDRIGIYPNVDFYAASVYSNLGIPDDLFINIFALGRISGWAAHMMEQYKNNTLIRPLQRYTGEKNKKYILPSKR